MAACKNLLLMAVLLLAAVVAAVALAAGGGEVGGEDYVDPMAAAGGYAVCRVGCPDALWDYNDWCNKNGHKNGGVCVPPQRQQCCCFA